jgi:hypothetical protein
MTELQATQLRPASRVKATTGRLFVLELSGDRIHSMSPDGTERKIIVTGCHFPAETPMGTYQGMTDQVVMSRTPGSFKTVLVPRGSSNPEWLAR